MNLADQLEKLQTLHAQGVLSEDEFVRAKKRVIEGGDTESTWAAAAANGAPSALQRLRRSTLDKWLGGVCGGLGEMSGIPTWSWRILFIFALLLHGIGLVLYVLMWILVPLAGPTPQVTPMPTAD